MLAAILIVLAGSGAHADLTGTLQISDRTEFRVRAYEGESQPAFDAATMPRAQLDLAGRNVTYSLGYSPSVTLYDIELGLEPQVFQTLSSRVSWRATRELRLSLGEDGSYGTQNYSTLTPSSTPGVAGAPSAPPAVQLLPGPQTIRYGASRTTGLMQLQATRLLTLTVLPTYFVGGGLDASSRTAIPWQNTARVELGLAYTVDRRDSITTSLAATDTDFTPFPCDPTTGTAPTATSLALTPNATCAPRDELVELSETWRRRLSRVDDLTLSAGLAGTYARAEPAIDGARLFPTAIATWTHRFHTDAEAHDEVTADTRVAPVIDVRDGTIDERVQARVAWTWTGTRATFTTDASFTQSLPPDEAAAVTYVGTDGEGLFAIDSDKRFEIGAGYRGAWQNQAPFSPFFTGALYAVFVYHEPSLRLWR